MDRRTIIAAFVAFDLAFLGFAGIGVFLGFSIWYSAIAGLVLGGLSALMIVGVARRAEGMPTPPDTPAPTEPSAPTEEGPS
ncbi:MAG: hypothetical protein R3249_03635 [Nitriliruptorales bacterium]|nr:hypothetical protein [Nitriliruptorales bacterium]